MSILPILSLSKSTWNLKDIALRQPSRDLTLDELKEPWLNNVVRDMFETLYSSTSGVGLAAPQIGLQLKIIVVDIKRNTKKPIVLINPNYVPLGKETVDSSESCLSVPNASGTVKRYSRVKVSFFNINGEYVEREATGFEGIVFQHEIDHLSGILYVDKLINDTVNENLGQANKMANRAIDNLTKENNDGK